MSRSQHNAPFRCWIRHKLKIHSPSLIIVTCDYGQRNDSEKCENCKHNLKEKWITQWQEVLVKVSAAVKAAAAGVEPDKKED